ncbi:MAG: S1-like domain-containing RNA-binding protein [Legionellaceae bacterium]|nr:S1-like domain-containing RNA-binding protein [Legionellaceae bacterium]
MLQVGQFNQLRVVKEVPFGVYLDGDDWGEILLPRKVVPEGAAIGDSLDVFIYFDSEDKIIATTKQPKIVFGHCAFLNVIDVNRVGAFLDWGLDKDLLVPKSEQRRPMQQDRSYLVYLTQDDQQRLVASSKLDYYLDKTPVCVKAGEEVDLLIAETTDLGTKVIVNHTHWGLIYAGDIFQTLQYGQRTRGYIKTVRQDGKLDVVLRKLGHNNIPGLAQRILDALKQADGFLAVHDKSSPAEIKHVFNESKKNFKHAIGTLYKQGIIRIESNGIYLQDQD